MVLYQVNCLVILLPALGAKRNYIAILKVEGTVEAHLRARLEGLREFLTLLLQIIALFGQSDDFALQLKNLSVKLYVAELLYQFRDFFCVVDDAHWFLAERIVRSSIWSVFSFFWTPNV